MKNGENNVTTISKKTKAEFVSATVNNFPPELAQKSKYYYYKLSFFLAAAIAILLLLPVTISGDGYFLYYGDYNVQQIPFYQHAVEMVRSGSINWDWGTDLGSGFLNNYAFYLSGSPFFWITCLFPSSLTPYLMAPMYVLKFATASFCAFLFLRRFVKKPGSALIGALLYAFSGFQVYNVFFNHFHDPVAFFPLMLWGIEETVQNKRKGVFAFSVCLCAMTNYVFFVGNCFFCVIYFIMRFAQKSFKITWKTFFTLAFEAVLGFVMSLVVVLPAVLSVMTNNRLDRSYSELKKALIYMTGDKVYWLRYGHILQSIFFPPDIPSRVNFFYGHTTRWASNAAWIPLFGTTGVISYFFSKRKKTLKFMIAFLVICALVPVLNSIFVMGNTGYYARWMYMIVLMMALATVIAIDDDTISFRPGLIGTGICCAAIAVPVALMWYKDEKKEELMNLGRGQMPNWIWISIAVAVACLIATHILMKYFRGQKIFIRAIASVLCVVILVYGWMHTLLGRSLGSDKDFLIDAAINGELTLEDDEFYRLDFYRTSSSGELDNLGLYWGYPTIQCFNSSVNTAILDFYPKVGVTRNVASRPESKYYGLRSFLSTKYSLISTSKTSKHDTSGFSYYDTQIYYTYSTSKTQRSYDVYVNDYYIPMGYTYTHFMTEKEFERVAKDSRHALLCRYLVVPNDKADYYSKFMTQVKYGDIVNSQLNEESYFQSCLDRLAGDVCDTFETSTNGATASINMDKKNLVFFSVPYDSGWSAYVNGKKVEVQNVYYGFMAVECPEGQCDIELKYEMPGLKIGFVATIVSLLVFVGYLFINRKSNGNYKVFKEEYYESEV